MQGSDLEALDRELTELENAGAAGVRQPELCGLAALAGVNSGAEPSSWQEPEWALLDRTLEGLAEGVSVPEVPLRKTDKARDSSTLSAENVELPAAEAGEGADAANTLRSPPPSMNPLLEVRARLASMEQRSGPAGVCSEEPDADAGAVELPVDLADASDVEEETVETSYESGVADLGDSGAGDMEGASLDEQGAMDSAVNLLADADARAVEDSGVVSLSMKDAAPLTLDDEPLTLDDEGLDSDRPEDRAGDAEVADSLAPEVDLFAVSEDFTGEINRLSDPDFVETEEEKTEIFSAADLDRALIPAMTPPPAPPVAGGGRKLRPSEPVPEGESEGHFEDASELVSEVEEIDLDADDLELIEIDEEVERADAPVSAVVPPPPAAASRPPVPPAPRRKR